VQDRYLPHLMDEEVLAVNAPIITDESIAHVQVHTHQAYASTTFNNSDEIRIAVQNTNFVCLAWKELPASGREDN